MRGYWVKILLGAVIVFVVGFGVVRLVRGGIASKRAVFDSAEPISIPLAFIPFTLDGREIGTFRRVTIRRDAPKVVAGIDVRVSLDESLPGMDLSACRLTTVEQGKLDIEEGFICLPAERMDSALVEFGSVEFRAADGTETVVPFFLDSAVVGEIRRSEEGVMATQRAIARDEAANVRVRVHQSAAEARRHADSMARLVTPRPPSP